MYAGEFSWDSENQAFYMRHKLSNGQFCLIAFFKHFSCRAIKYYVAFAVADKKKNLNGYFNGNKDNNLTLKMTGRCGAEALFWGRDRLLEFERSVHLDKTYDTVVIITGEDSRRFRVYARGLARYGYKKVLTADGWTVQRSLGTQ